MTSGDIHYRMIHAGNTPLLTHDPLKDLSPQQIFDVCHALRREVDAIEALGVQLLAESKTKAVSA